MQVNITNSLNRQLEIRAFTAIAMSIPLNIPFPMWWSEKSLIRLKEVTKLLFTSIFASPLPHLMCRSRISISSSSQVVVNAIITTRELNFDSDAIGLPGDGSIPETLIECSRAAGGSCVPLGYSCVKKRDLDNIFKVRYIPFVATGESKSKVRRWITVCSSVGSFSVA